MSDLTLRPQDLRLGRLLQWVRDAIIVADSTTGRILLWNQTATRVFGYSSSEALGLVFEDLVPGLFDERHGAGAPSQIETDNGAYVGSRELLRLPAVRKGGEEITVEMSLSPVEQLDGHGEVGGRFVLAIVRDATERERTHDLLVESERRFAAVLSNTRAYVYRCFNEPGYPNEFASDYALELTGYPPQDLLVDGGVRFGDLIVEEDRGRVWAELQEALAARRSFALRYAIRRKDGATRRVEEFGRGIYDEEGNVEALEGIVYDVTDVALTEERLRQAEARYRQLIERLPAIVYVEEMNGRMSTVYDSPQIETMLGYPRDKYVEDPDYWAKILHPDDREWVLAAERRAIASGEPLSHEYRVVARDGRTVWVRDEAVIVRGRDEDRSYFQGFIFDITERKEAERRLQETEARYRTLVEQIPAVVYIQEIEHQGAISYISPQIEELMGYSAEEYMQYTDLWVRTTHPDDRERVLDEYARTDETGLPFRVEFRKITRDGRVIWVRDEAVLVRDADGNPLYWQGIFTDITERKRTESALEESEQRFRQLFEQSVDALFVHDERGRFVDCNSQACRLLGYSREELLDLSVSDVSLNVLAGEERKAKEEGGGTLWQRALAGAPGTFALSHEERNVRKDGSVFPAEVRVGSVDYGGRRMILASVRDITERKRTEEELRRNEARHRAVLDNAFDAVITASADGTIRSFNRRAETMFGYGAEEVIGRQLSILMPEHAPNGSARYVEEYRPGRTFEVAARRKDGTEFPIELSIAEVREEDDVFLTGIVRDITERKLFEAQLTYQALHDPLTRLPNRTLFLDRLEQALAQTRRRQNVNVAVFFMDLDDFKNVNDSLGHDVGDELLKAVGTRLKSRLRPGDTAARLGGDEFAILLEDVRGVEDASLVARRIIEDIKAPFVLMGYELFFTVSIGISLSTSERDRAEEMLRDADLAMYQAKEKGKATYQVFDSAMYGRVLDRLSLDRDLRRACRRDEFVIHYQPKVRLQTGRIFGVEALVRWDRPGRGLMLPEEFVPVAEENGLIVPIGRRTLDEACRRASEWRERYPHDLFKMVSVNLSASQLQHAYLLEETVATLHRTGLDPRNLNLEITESVVMSDVPTNAATLDKLRELGIELAIDDFGKGYSSLSYLKRFPVSYLKIDRSFVEELREGSEDRALVSGIIALAHTLGMQVIAEGVESAEQLRILRELGCDMAQGFYFSEPLTHDEMSALLDADPRW